MLITPPWARRKAHPVAAIEPSALVTEHPELSPGERYRLARSMTDEAARIAAAKH